MSLLLLALISILFKRSSGTVFVSRFLEDSGRSECSSSTTPLPRSFKGSLYARHGRENQPDGSNYV